MRKYNRLLFGLFLIMVLFSYSIATLSAIESEPKEEERYDEEAEDLYDEELDEEEELEEVPPAMPDQIEPVNRVMFTVNDKLYFWIFKPTAKGYNYVMPEESRVAVRNFFYNIMVPIRFVNCLLQAKLTRSGVELARFGINTTIGLLGFFDPALNRYHLKTQNEDLGQTLAVYGLEHGMYLTIPAEGPSSLRDGTGRFIDSFLNPITYLGPFGLPLVLWEKINKTSLHLGEYEGLKEASFDPYIAIRSAYSQYREKAVKE